MVTVTFTDVPRVPAGTTALSCDELTHVTPGEDLLPNVTVAPDSKFDPLIATVMPPEPELGETPETVGAPGAIYVKAEA